MIRFLKKKLSKAWKWIKLQWKAAYANTTFYRVFWTTIQVGAGYVAAVWSNDPRVGVLVTLITTMITSIAREKIADRKLMTDKEIKDVVKKAT